ncbi:hypothetical protein [Streptomyces sp. NPDC052225]|uniref:hypothetical protein n=1 Tax=Streptomyces sp. NPDC052225 TaxID=3154949 RepID=UPI00343EEFFA
MADSEDHQMNVLASHLAHTYIELARLCRLLPMPITLEEKVYNFTGSIPAVRRAAELALDEPMPEDMQANLFNACTFWLGGLDLFVLLANPEEFHTVRAHSAAGCLIQADIALRDLGIALRNLS